MATWSQWVAYAKLPCHVSIWFVVVLTLLIAMLTFVLVMLTATINVLLLCPDAAKRSNRPAAEKQDFLIHS